MTVDSQNNKISYSPDGLTSTFPYDFRVDEADDMVVYADNEVYTGGFSVTGLTNPAGGNVVFDIDPPASIAVLTLVREVPLTQDTAYPAVGPFPAESHEAALDKLTFIAQQQQEALDRAVTSPVDADPATDFTPPSYVAGGFWVWDILEQKLVTSVALEAGLIRKATDAELSSGAEAAVDAFVDPVQLKKYSSTIVSNIAALRALTYAPKDDQVVKVLGYSSSSENQDWDFRWSATDLSTEVAADTQGGIYVALDSDPTGASGAFVRLFDYKTVNVQHFGATGSSSGDDTIAIDAAAAYADTLFGSTLYFPGNGDATVRYVKTTPTTFTTSVDVRFESKNVTYLAYLCDGFVWPVGASRVTVRDASIVPFVSHAVTSNSYRGLYFPGTFGTGPYTNTIKNVLINGFGVSIKLEHWGAGSIINNQLLDCGVGIQATGQCINNFVHNNTISGLGELISLSAGIYSQQGWFIDSNFISGGGIGHAVGAEGTSFNKFTNNICDFMGSGTAILLLSGTTPSGAWDIVNNYIACSDGGDAGIRMYNNLSFGATLNTGNTIKNNTIFAYTGSLVRGILIDGIEEENNIVTTNKVRGSYIDCDIKTGVNTIVKDNQWKGAGAAATVLIEYSGNNGLFLSAQSLIKQSTGLNSHYYNSSTPATGAYVAGDYVEKPIKAIDVNNMVLQGWDRLTTGSGHVLGTDWAKRYTSHVSPAN